MNLNFFEKETGSALERIGIDFSFMRSFAFLSIEKQHEITKAYLRAVQAILHPDKNPDLTESEQQRVAALFNQFAELKNFAKFAKQLAIFRSDRSRFASHLNEVKRDRKHFADEWKRTLKKLTVLQKENNLLAAEIRKLKQGAEP